MAENPIASYEAQVEKFMATLGDPDDQYASWAREILTDFGVFTFPELAQKAARKRALDKLNEEDLKALGLEHVKE